MDEDIERIARLAGFLITDKTSIVVTDCDTVIVPYVPEDARPFSESFLPPPQIEWFPRLTRAGRLCRWLGRVLKCDRITRLGMFPYDAYSPFKWEKIALTQFGHEELEQPVCVGYGYITDTFCIKRA